MPMIKRLLPIFVALLFCAVTGCNKPNNTPQIAATTLPVYEFTSQLCNGTDICVSQLINENVSCLHNYTLQVNQMRTIESVQVLILSGAGLEDFMGDILETPNIIIDASVNVPVINAENAHEHAHSHDHGIDHHCDSHIWLSPANARIMSQNIYNSLVRIFPEHTNRFTENLNILLAEIDTLEQYGTTQLSALACRNLITFHDGFAYFAEAFDLSILKSVEEESGSEVAASELIEIIELVHDYNLPAIFTEKNSSTAAASVIEAETGVSVFELDMAMAGDSYFDAMYYNIDTLKEAFG